MLKEDIEVLVKDMAEIQKSMKEKVDKGQMEYKELTDRLIEVEKKLTDRKAEFELKGNAYNGTPAEAEKKLDELFIASAIMRNKGDNTLNIPVYKSLQAISEYKDALEFATKVTGLTFGGQNVGTSADGGYTVPTGFSSTLLSEIFLQLKVASIFNRFTMPNSSFKFPLLTNRLRARKSAEATAINKDKAAFAQISFDAKKLMANLCLLYTSPSPRD